MSLPRRFAALKKIFDAADVHVVIVNPDGRIIYANAAAEKHTGFMMSEMIGKKPGELWGGKMPKEFYLKMWQTIDAEKSSFTGDMRNCRKRGEPYWQEVHVLPVLDQNGGIQCFLGIEFDPKSTEEKDSFLQLVSEDQLLSLNVKWPDHWEVGEGENAVGTGS